MQILLGFLVALLTLFSCTSIHRITQTEYDPDKQVYLAGIEGTLNMIYLRDDQFNLIRNEADKDRFISNFNQYWLMDEKDRTNEYYNTYARKGLDLEFLNNVDLNKNYECSTLYFSGVKLIKSSNYTEAVSHFDRLIQKYPDIRRFSDVLFLKAYCYEQLNDSNQSVSNYQLFLNTSVQRYSYIFAKTEQEDPIGYIEEVKYSYQAISNANRQFPQENLSHDIALYYNHEFNAGFIYQSPQYNIDYNIVVGYNLFDGLNAGMQVIIPINSHLNFIPTIYFSESSIITKFGLPIQIYKSEDHRAGFEVTPLLFYTYYYRTKLSDDIDAPFESIGHNVINPGIETSFGYYIFPSLFAALSVKYMLFNQFFNYDIQDKINGVNYQFSYGEESFYRVSLTYYIVRDLGLEGALKNNDFYIGLKTDGLYFGYNISQNKLDFTFYEYY